MPHHGEIVRNEDQGQARVRAAVRASRLMICAWIETSSADDRLVRDHQLGAHASARGSRSAGAGRRRTRADTGRRCAQTDLLEQLEPPSRAHGRAAFTWLNAMAPRSGARSYAGSAKHRVLEDHLHPRRVRAPPSGSVEPGTPRALIPIICRRGAQPLTKARPRVVFPRSRIRRRARGFRCAQWRSDTPSTARSVSDRPQSPRPRTGKWTERSTALIAGSASTVVDNFRFFGCYEPAAIRYRRQLLL